MDKGRQTRRQSKDFNEIRNTHTDASISQETWDRAIHNYDNPELCNQNKRIEGCTVCRELEKKTNQQ
jgi:hypothetical protein